MVGGLLRARCERRSTAAAVLVSGALLLSATAALAQAPALSAAHDGRWSVLLSCADTRDKSGHLVKGYDFNFFVDIRDGRLKGQHGSAGSPSSVVYTGTVAPDGTLEIEAVGHTGKREHAFNVPQGTPYSYTLQGKLEATKGQAVRRELRPCTAVFTRQSP